MQGKVFPLWKPPFPRNSNTFFLNSMKRACRTGQMRLSASLSRFRVNACFIVSLFTLPSARTHLAAERSVSFCGTDNACSIVSLFTLPSARTPQGPLTANTVKRQAILPHKADARGKPRAKVLLQKHACLALQACLYIVRKRIFKFLGKGFGENPLFKEGSPR